ncbi:MAG: hypothetical protein HY013_20335 [Candidatus Solibacter usitatus]|nr:hypothetical protein [Candidatus Solibacter usitatus]
MFGQVATSTTNEVFRGRFALNRMTGEVQTLPNGFTVAGGLDNRLGDVRVVLLTQRHTDHLEGMVMNQNPNDRSAKCDNTCAESSRTSSSGSSVSVRKD